MKHGPSTLISVIVITVSSLAVTPAATAQSTCGAQTTAAAGETLADVAERCDVALDALMEANPGLSEQEVAPGVEIDMPGIMGSDLLGRARDAVRQAGEEVEGAAESVGRSVTDYLSDNPDLSRDILEFGERVGLPGVSAEPSAGANVVVSPRSAGIGDEVTVSASGLRGDAKVAIGAGPPDGDYQVLTETTANAAGRVEATVVIPEWASGEDALVFVVESERVSVLSEPLQITGN
jgi:hypothetical protein